MTIDVNYIKISLTFEKLYLKKLLEPNLFVSFRQRSY